MLISELYRIGILKIIFDNILNLLKQIISVQANRKKYVVYMIEHKHYKIL